MSDYFAFDQSGFPSLASAARFDLQYNHGLSESETVALSDEDAIYQRCERGFARLPEPERSGYWRRAMVHKQQWEDALALNYLSEIVGGYIYGVDKNGVPSRINVLTNTTQSDLDLPLCWRLGFQVPVAEYVKAKGYKREDVAIAHSHSMAAILYDFGPEVLPWFYVRNEWGTPQVKRT